MGPRRFLLAGEDDLRRLRGRLVAPDVPVAEWRVAAYAGGVEPRMAVRGVVGHEIDDHPKAAVARRPHEAREVAQRAEVRVHAVEVGDVIPVVAPRRRVEGHQPQACDAKAREVVDPLCQPRQITAPVAVVVEECLDIDAVDDRVLPPQVAGLVDPRDAGFGREAVDGGDRLWGAHSQVRTHGPLCESQLFSLESPSWNWIA